MQAYNYTVVSQSLKQCMILAVSSLYAPLYVGAQKLTVCNLFMSTIECEYWWINLWLAA